MLRCMLVLGLVLCLCLTGCGDGDDGGGDVDVEAGDYDTYWDVIETISAEGYVGFALLLLMLTQVGKPLRWIGEAFLFLSYFTWAVCGCADSL